MGLYFNVCGATIEVSFMVMLTWFMLLVLGYCGRLASARDRVLRHNEDLRDEIVELRRTREQHLRCLQEALDWYVMVEQAESRLNEHLFATRDYLLFKDDIHCLLRQAGQRG